MRRDTGSETIYVYPEVETTDEYGNTILRPGDVDNDEPIVVPRCRVQPVTNDSDATQGLSLTTVYRVLCANFPGGPRSAVRWRGDVFYLQAEPAVHRGSRRTAHDTAYMHAAGPLVGD